MEMLDKLKVLELKIPPPFIMLICAILVFLLKNIEPFLPLDLKSRSIIGGIFIITGICCDLTAAISFQKVKTTINPWTPNHTSSFVHKGIYKITRNPMYLGLCLVLTGWIFINHSMFGFLFIPFFVKYVETFQIKPEERIMEAKFGQEYLDYKAKTRRWL